MTTLHELRVALLLAAAALVSAQVKVCVPFAKDAAYLASCAAMFNAQLAPTTFSCITGPDSNSCMAKVKTGEADLSIFGGDELYSSNKDYGLVPAVSEDYGNGGAEYFAVTVTTKKFCDAQTGPINLASLKGKRSCHTGYRKTSGWALPVGYLISNNISPVVDSVAGVNADAETIASFFSTVCAPGTKASPPGPRTDGTLWTGSDSLCTGCKGSCSTSDPYYDYKGAMYCLMDGGGDVAFVKHTSPAEYAKDGTNPQTWSNYTKAEMRLICPTTNGCVGTDQWATCNTGKAAAKAVMVRPGWAGTTLGSTVVAKMISVQATFVPAAKELGGQANFFFSASTQSLDEVQESFSSYFSANEEYDAIRALDDADTTKVCIPLTKDAAYLANCTNMFNTQLAPSRFSCLLGPDANGCMSKVESGAADLSVFGGDELYSSNKNYGLTPVLSEDYGVGQAEYYAVAVTTKAFCDAQTGPINLATLKGKRSCHTGYRKTSGWALPVGYLIASKLATVATSAQGVNADAQTVANYFSTVCAPGTKASPPGPRTDGSLWTGSDSLCTGCKGDCSTSDPYYDYKGAMYCLHDDAADVAFVKHTSPAEYAKDGTNPQTWSKYNKADLRLICPTGNQCVTIDNFGACNSGTAAAKAVVARPDWADTTTGTTVLNKMVAASTTFLPAAKEFQGQANFFFSASTKSIAKVEENFTQYFTAKAEYDAIRQLDDAQSTVRWLDAEQAPARMCVPFAKDAAYLSSCKTMLESNLQPHKFECVAGPDSTGCMAKIQDGTADISIFGGDELYGSNKDFGLEPVLSEGYGNGQAEYYAVAVTTKAFCDAQTGPVDLAALRGKRSCHTGYRKTSGWVLPVGYLIESGIAAVVNSAEGVNADAETVASFFSTVCAPGTKATPPGPRSDGSLWTGSDSLCTGCKGNCTTADPYYDYKGAMYCLMDDAGDVAFVKHTSPAEYAKDGTSPQSWSKYNKADLRLICPTGNQCVTIDKYGACNIGTAAAKAVVARPGWGTSTAGFAIVDKMVSSATTFIPAAKEFGGQANFLFSASTKTIAKVTEDFATYFTAEAEYDAIRQLDDADVTKVCIPLAKDAAYLANCTTMFNTQLAPSRFSCVTGPDSVGCMSKIDSGTADISVFGGDELYAANTDYDLVPVVSEDYGVGQAEYYAVAVVTKAFCDAQTGPINLAALKGKRSCHTGYRKTSGWALPVGYLISNNISTVVNSVAGVNADAETIASFFSTVCAPGTKASPPGPRTDGSLWTGSDSLCTGCKGNCTTADPYYDYKGAMNCLMDDAADVAFVKHTSPLEYAKDGTSPQSWSKYTKAQLRLVCPTGNACMELDRWASCNTGTAAAKAVVARPGWATANAGSAVVNKMVAAQSAFVPAAKEFGGQANFFFSASTKNITKVDESFADYFTAKNEHDAIRKLDDADVAKVCVPYNKDAAFMSACTSMFNTQLGPTRFSCVLGPDSGGCMSKVESGAADMAMFGGDELFASNNDYDLVPALAEDYGNGQAEYQAVAVVTKAFCDAQTGPINFATLKGKRSCHTGYRKTSGWVLPVGWLISNDVADVTNNINGVNADAETMASYFSTVCAPGTKAVPPGPRTDGSLWTGSDSLCSGCKGDCSTSDPYYDYKGAMYCLHDDAADVAFVKHTSPAEYAKDGTNPQTWSKYNKADLRLVCPQGDACVGIDEFASCNSGTAAAHAVVVRPGWSTSTIGSTVVDKMASSRTTFVPAAKEFQGQANFFFSASTKTISKVDESFADYFTASQQYSAIHALDNPVVLVCIPFAKDAAYVSACASMFNTRLAPMKFTCVLGPDNNGCMAKIKAGDADITIFGGDELYSSNKDYGLVPIVSEDYGNGQAEYYAVAVTTKAFCDAQTGPVNLAALKGKRSCHTGYRKTSGWVLPVGYMASNNIMPAVDKLSGITADAESVASYFSKVCAPGTKASPAGPQSDGSLWTGTGSLCAGCKGDCSTSDPYYDYKGAMYCLMDGAGDVAFAKHTSAKEYAKDGDTPQTWSKYTKAELRLICPSGSQCVDIDKYASCNTGTAAAKAVVTRSAFATSSVGRQLANKMVSAGSDFVTAAKEFGGQTNFFFSASTKSIAKVDETFAEYFTASAEYEAIRSLSVPNVRVCTTSAAENTFCQNAASMLNGKNLGTTFSCVMFASDDECVLAIRDGQADMRTFDGSMIYRANKLHDLKVIAGEDYGLSSATEYYAVAVVPAATCTATSKLADLKGKRSCHTGFRKSSGWTAPVGYMLSTGIMPIVRNNAGVQDDAESVASFFSKTCAPRPTDNGPLKTADKKGGVWSPMCSACKGDCGGDATKEPYYDYAGAFRCLTENAGDVAFTKHTTAMEYSKDGSTPQSWSSQNMDAWRLLCPTGGCAPVSQFLQCNIVRVPSHGVMVSSQYTHSMILKAALVAAGNDKQFQAMVFNGTSNPNNYLFKSSTKNLVPINDDTKSFLGTSLASYQGLETITDDGSTNSPSPPAMQQPSGGGNNLSDGAIAGIVIGCCVFVAIVAVLATVLAMRRKYGVSNKYTTGYPAGTDTLKTSLSEHLPQSSPV